MTDKLTKRIEQFDIYSYTVAVQQAVLEGFTVSSDNEHFPTAWAGYYSAVFVKDTSAEEEPKVQAEAIIPELQQESKPVKQTRTKK